MGIQLADLGEFQGTLVAHVLLHLVVGLHVVIEVRHLGKRSAAVILDADKGPFSSVQSTVIVQVRDLRGNEIEFSLWP